MTMTILDDSISSDSTAHTARHPRQGLGSVLAPRPLS